LEGKTRAELGLKEFTKTEILSTIMEIPITITEEIIGRVARKDVGGKFQWKLNKKTSSWIQTTYDALYKHNVSDKYKDMKKKKAQRSLEADPRMLLTQRRRGRSIIIGTQGVSILSCEL